MPTGYTATLCDGPQSFAEFVKEAAAGMSVVHFYGLRTGIEPDEYFVTSINEHQAEIARLESLTESEIYDEFHAERKAFIDREAERITQGAEVIERLWAMLRQVRSWAPPTDEHEAFKAFMIEQLVTTIEFDSPRPRSWDYTSSEDWLKKKLAEAHRSLAFAEERYAAELDRVDYANRWVSALLEDLDD